MDGKDQQTWRTLDELAGKSAHFDALHREFAPLASEWPDGPSRRNFLKLMGASVALAGASAGIGGCGQEQDESIVPYVVPPEQVTAGKPLYFATAMPLAGYGRGVLVESNMGRPTKVDGNPDHPGTLGKSDVFMQASILDLWDPQRAQTVRQAGQISTWGGFLAALNAELEAKNKSGGAGMRILTGAVTSPTLLDQLQRLAKKFPQARFHHWEPINSDNARLGSKLAFGKVVETIYHFDRAKVICSLDSNFLLDGPGAVRYALEFSEGRRVRAGVDKEGKASEIEAKMEMSRLYVAESTPSITGAMADQRVRLQAKGIERLAREAAKRVGIGSAEGSNFSSEQTRWLESAVADLQAAKGASIVIAGAWQPPVVHALAHGMNEALGNSGKTVTYHVPVEGHDQESMASLRQLVNDMSSGAVDLLLILGPNPILTAPNDLNFAAAMNKVKVRVQQSQYYDATSAFCHWHIPESHYLESWSDIRAYDGTASIIQPLIAPLYQSKSSHQVLAALLGESDAAPLAMVKEFWRKRIGGDNFEQVWHEALRKGYIGNTLAAPVQVQVNKQAAGIGNPFVTTAPSGTEINFRPDPTLFDGRFANNGWLQELPKPLTKLTWDNAALISQNFANQLDVANGDIVQIETHAGNTNMPVWILPGHPDDSVSVYLTQSRRPAFNAYKLRSADAPWFTTGRITPTRKNYRLACTQPHQMIESPSTRDLIRFAPIEEFKKEIGGHHNEQGEKHRVHLSLFPSWDYSKGHQWAMTIDNNVCIGCNACVIACQAENNIPVVGKEEVLRSREMHWLRIDTYYHGEASGDPDTYFEPVTCMHCETAPCELVCPVNATTHSAEGLNEMTYNRCIGTRYCSNNCPYKVRRFNFFQYTKPADPTYLLRANPEVTVRERGVMEKCTYCVQRINRTRVEIKKLEVTASEAQSNDEKSAARQLMDRAMQQLETACQQACPTNAIIFGDLNWPDSHVARLQKQPHDYGLLEELNTRPRTRYLARFTNRGGNA